MTHFYSKFDKIRKSVFFNEIVHQFSEDSFPYNGFQIAAH